MKWDRWFEGQRLMDESSTVTAYLGEYTHRLDARHRVSIPSDWRVAGDGQNYYMAWPHPDGCIALYPPEMQKEFLEKARAIPQSDRKGQAMLRQFFGKAHRLGCDNAGRILLPEPLRKDAQIDKEVVFVGMGRNFQIWASERYQNDDNFDLLEYMSELQM